MATGLPTVGVSGTWSVPGDDRLREVSREVTVYDKVSSPFMTWLSMTVGRLKPTQQTLFEWYEDQYDHGKVTCAAGFTGGSDTETVILDSPGVIVGDSFFEPITQQYFIVDSVVANNPTTSEVILQIVPFAGTIVATVGSTVLASCGMTMIENGYVPDAKGGVPTRFTNSITKSAVTISVTTEEALSPNYWGNKWPNDKERQMAQLKKDIERNLLFSKFFLETGYTQTTTAGGREGTLRGTRGLLNGLTRTGSYSGSLTKPTLNTTLRTLVWPDKYSGSPTKMSLWGPDASNDIATDLEQQIRLLPNGQAMYGLDFRYYLYGAGRKIIVMEEPEFYDFAPYTKGIVFVDPANIWMRQYGPNLMEIKDTTPFNADYHSMSIITMYGLERRFEASHAALKKV